MGNPKISEKIGFAGKGLTFDTGGYSLKPSTSTDTIAEGRLTLVYAVNYIIEKENLEKVVEFRYYRTY